jgi:hypothetical protein
MCYYEITLIKKASQVTGFFIALQGESGVVQAESDQTQPESSEAKNNVGEFFHQQFIDFFQHALVS